MQFGVIGDIHGCWDARDTAFFNAAGYDMLLFVGDFARIANSRPVARRLAGLTTPAWAIPGNHDGVTLPQLVAEINNRPLLARIAGYGMARRVRAMARAMAPVRLGGYSLDVLANGLGLIVARPHAAGPNRFYYRNYLRRYFGVDGFAASAARLNALIDAAPRDLVFLAHNGPAGLGDTPEAPFGCDFDSRYRDFGAPDLRAAVEHARASGHRVRAVIAGHMHHYRKRTDIRRQTWANDGATLYLNAARVPRIAARGVQRHHICLRVDPDAIAAETRYVNAAGDIVAREPIAATD